jgi:hypothetical protein
VNAITGQAPLTFGAAAASRLGWRQLAFFHLALPVLLSLPQGFSRPGLQFSLPVSVLWWALTWTAAWTCSEAFSRLSAAALRPWRPPLWVVLLSGSLLAGLSSRFWTVPLFDLVATIEMPPMGEEYRTFPRSFSDPVYVGRLAQSLVSGSVAWLVANYVYERLTGVPRFAVSTAPRKWLRAGAMAEPLGGPRSVPLPGPDADRGPIGALSTSDPSVASAITATAVASATVPASPDVAAATRAVSPSTASPSAQDARELRQPVTAGEPRFLSRMARFPGTTLEQLLAVEAEDHYVKVHTTAGSELVYYRFADALEDLRAHDGLQVHRSFWVRRAAVERVDTHGRQWEVVLPRGLRVPVSRANQGALRLARLVR